MDEKCAEQPVRQDARLKVSLERLASAVGVPEKYAEYALRQDALLKISLEHLAEALGLPLGTKIIGVLMERDVESKDAIVIVEHPSLPAHCNPIPPSVELVPAERREDAYFVVKS